MPTFVQYFNFFLLFGITHSIMLFSTNLFSTNKVGHFAQILSTGLLGQVVSQNLTPPDPSQVELYGHLVIQILVAVVTIWATIRKTLQTPESVLRVPVASVTAVAAPATLTVTAAAVAAPAAPADAQ